MPGRLSANFRSGNLAEHLGLLLLKGLAAVAEISRQEDVGLDAVATLLRLDPDGNYYAEDSFVVQLKAESVKSIKYEGQALEWFHGQTQPMFVGSVSLAKGEISLYTTLHARQSSILASTDRMELIFGDSGIPSFCVGREHLPWMIKDDGSVVVWLGEPILRWKLDDISNRQWRVSAYTMLSRFLARARGELRLLSLRHSTSITWRTNEPDSFTSVRGPMMASPDDFEKLVHEMAPSLLSVGLIASSGQNQQLRELAQNIVKVFNVLRTCGMEADEYGLLQMTLTVMPPLPSPSPSAPSQSNDPG